VHVSRGIDGHVRAGPAAVLRLKREASSRTAFNPRDLAETLAYPPFWWLARQRA
jgi:L-2-hydroxyglutarate oxidase